MSAESELSNMLNHARNNASSLAASSESLVDSAIDVLTSTVEFPTAPNQSEVKKRGLNQPWTQQLHVVPDREQPIDFPQWPEIEFTDPPELTTLEPVGTSVYYGIGATGDGLPEFPELALPAFSYSSVPRIDHFSKVAPEFSVNTAVPSIQTTHLPSSPIWMPLRNITKPSLHVTPPTFAPIDTSIDNMNAAYQDTLDQFNTAIFSGSDGVPGLDSVLSELTTWMDRVIDALLNPVLSIVAERFTDVSATILKFHQEIQDRLTERLKEEQDRVAAIVSTDRSGWDLPVLVQQALTAMTHQVSQSWMQQAQSQTTTKVEELKLEFFEFCGGLCESLQKIIVTAKTNEIEYILETHKQAIAYAKQSIRHLLSLYSLENFTQQDFFFKEAEAKLRLFEAELKVAMIRYEAANAKLRVEKIKQDQDALEIKQYQQETEAASLDVQMYASQIEAIKTELAIKKLPFEVFEAQVKAFDAQIDGYTALVSSQIAELEGDSAKVEGEKAKVRAHLAKVRGFEKSIQVKRETINSQIQRNEAVINQYESEIRAFFAPIEQSLLLNEYELKKYAVIIDDYLADAKIAAEAAKVDLEFLQKEQEGLMTAFQATQERGIDLMNFELKRLDAIADVNAKGAAIMADMAGGAMSAANGIANVVLSEGT